jgi:hypothetical protein
MDDDILMWTRHLQRDGLLLGRFLYFRLFSLFLRLHEGVTCCCTVASVYERVNGRVKGVELSPPSRVVTGRRDYLQLDGVMSLY